MSTRRLLLDAGNTRLKWALVEAGVWLEQGSANYLDLSTLGAALRGGEACYIACVTQAKHRDMLEALLASFGIVPVWLSAADRFGGLVNAYEDPGQLGVDRWMGLIGARQRCLEPALVVSAGTAMTVDALSDQGVFLGGLIVPGGSLMREALLQGTAGVSEVAGHWQAFPCTTADAVESGIVSALCGAIQLQYGRLQTKTGKKPRCLMTGGDAERLLPHLGFAVELVPALVLEGIDCLARQGVSG